MTRNPPTPVNALAFAGVAALVTLGLAACTNPAEPSPTPSASASVNGLPEGVTLPEDVPVDVPNDPDDRLNVAIATCEASDGGWLAAGTAVNPSGSGTTYDITVFFTTETGTVIGYGSTSISVAASETADWAVEADFVAPESTQCVLRGAAAG